MSLPERDEEYLGTKGFDYEIIHESGTQYERLLIIHNYDMGEKYIPRHVDLLIKIPVGYPDSPLDMFWVHPFVTKLDGTTPVQSEYRESLNGRIWQRFSRHYTAPWRPNIDSIVSHLMMIQNELSTGR